jgi:hypothetical protein
MEDVVMIALPIVGRALLERQVTVRMVWYSFVCLTDSRLIDRCSFSGKCRIAFMRVVTVT